VAVIATKIRNIYVPIEYSGITSKLEPISRNSPIYVYSKYPTSGTGGVGGLSWSGSTANAIGTYGGTTIIVAEPNLRYDAGDLFLGDASASYNNYSFNAVFGGTSAGNLVGLELIGHQTSNATVGSISFHNVASTLTDKKIIEIFLVFTRTFVWVYEWWNAITVFIFVYIPFFVVACYAYYWEPKKQRNVIVVMAIINIGLLIIFGSLGMI